MSKRERDTAMELDPGDGERAGSGPGLLKTSQHEEVSVQDE